MGLVSQSIKNLKGGISQQPDILRFADQGEKQVNAFSSEVEGLQKRPPSTHVNRLGNHGAFSEKPYCHVINRDEQEKYVLFFGNNTVYAYDLLTGQNVPVNFPSGASYVTTTNPRNDLRMVTVADFTFIINRNVVVQEGSTRTPMHYQQGKHGLVYCRGGQYARTYQIIVNGSVSATYVAPLGDQIAHAKEIDTQYILTKLAESFNATSGASGWSASVQDGYLWIQAGANTITSLKVVDGFNGQLLECLTYSAQKTVDLPVTAPDKYQVLISGDAAQGQDDFWVQYDAARRVWSEIPAPNIIADLNKNTMPWVMIRESNGQFTLRPTDWSTRGSGDDDTNPMPSFVGQTINDVFFFRNRLGFLSGENVVMSEAGSYFNFFPRSVAVTADSDPIDVAVSTNRISILKYAVPFSEELLLWSDQSQFVMTADGILTPTSVRLDMTTEFEVTDSARPYGIGRGVYFIAPRAKYSSVRRYYAVQDVTQVKNAEDVTAHVPSYIPNGVHKVTGSSIENLLTVLTEGAPHKVFLYKFLYLEEQIAQQSWSEWDFGEGSRVLCCDMMGAIMHLVIDAPSGIYMERIEFTQNTKDYPNEPYRLYMDRKIRYTIPSGAYNDDNFETTIYLQNVYGAKPQYGKYFIVLESGVVYELDPPDGGWAASDGGLRINGNLEGYNVFIGEQYTMLYQFSKFLIKSVDTNGGTTTEDIGRLQLRRAWVNYDKSGDFRIEVNNQGRTFTYNMTGRRLGTKQLVLGEQNLDTGQFKFPVSGNAKIVNITLLSDAPSPVAIIGGGWEGNYIRRSSGI